MQQSKELLALFQVMIPPSPSIHCRHEAHTQLLRHVLIPLPPSLPPSHTPTPTSSSSPPQQLLQVVLDVGNALNAGTGKGNAVGFKLGALLKLSELKSSDKGDKKTTLLHFVVEVRPPRQRPPAPR